VRIVVVAMTFAVLAGAFCARSGNQQSASAASTKWPKEALGALGEDELVQFAKALPALDGALKAAKWETKPQKEGTSPLSTLTDLVEGMKVAGINESLKPFGGWAKIRPTLYKVFAATAAVVIDRTSPDMLERMRQDTTAGGRRSLQDYEFFRTATRQVPEANKQLVAKYQEQLQPLGSLGR